MKKYDVIYCDPPWQYGNKSTGGTSSSGAADQYSTLTLDELKQMQLPAAKNCILFLWATAPLLPWAFELLQIWNFTYKTTFIWDKQRLGLGYWFRVQTEFLLVATKGTIKPFRSNIRNIHYELRTKHSKKPTFFTKLIEVLTPKQKRLEMFARGNKKGWDTFGFETYNSIIIKSK